MEIADPKKEIFKNMDGAHEKIALFNNQVLVAVYVRPEKTKGGVFLAAQTRDEDKHQSKVGLYVAGGPKAFDDPSGKWFDGADVKIGEWLVFRPSDGWPITVNGVLCRVFTDTEFKGIANKNAFEQIW